MTRHTAPAGMLGAIIDRAAAAFAEAGIDGGAADARLLAAAAFGTDRAGLIAGRERPVDPDRLASFEAMVARRAAREPVSRILGRRGFWTLELAVTPATLDPRPDSETVVEAAVGAVLARQADREAPCRVLDLGTGTGCLLLAILAELPGASGVGVDRSEAAARTALGNADVAGLADRAGIVVGDWAEPLAGPFDLVVANPPYIPAGDIAGLMPEVRLFDPEEALAGGEDGLAAYRDLAPGLARVLTAGGVGALEVGAGQADAVEAVLRGVGLVPAGRRRDLGGVERCVLCEKRVGMGLEWR